MTRLRTCLLLALAALCLGVAGFSGASFSASSSNSGNTFSAAADFVPPAVTLTSPTDGATTDATPTFSGAAGTAAGDTDTITVKIYDGTSATGDPVQTRTATATAGAWTVDATTLGEGTYTARAQQTDSDSNTGFSGPVTFTVDATSPAVTLVAPADGLRTNDTTPAFSGAAGNATGDSTTVTVKIYSGTGTGGTLVETLTPTRTGATWTDTSAGLTPGTYTAQATQTDNAGNSTDSSAHTFVIDTTGPALTLTAPVDGSSTNDTTPALSGAGGTATGDSGTVTVKIYNGTGTGGTLNQTRTATVTAGTYTVDATTLTNGNTYTAQATQTDSAGNSSDSTANTFIVDTSNPSVTNPAIAATSAGNPVGSVGFVRPSGTYKIYANASDASSSVSTVTANVNNVTTGQTAVTLTHSVAGVTIGATTYHYISAELTANAGLSSGSKSFTVTAIDAASNSSGAVSASVTSDTSAPSSTMTDPGSPLRLTVSLGATASDSESGIASVTIQRSPANANTWTNVCTDTSSPFSCSLDTLTVSDGLYDFRAVSVSNAGATTNSSLREDRRIDNTSPTLTGFSVTPAGTLSGTATLSATSTDAGSGVDNVKFEYSPAGAGTWTTICTDTSSSYSCTFATTTVADGNYDFRAVSTDNAGNTSAAATDNRTIDNPIRGIDVQANNGDNQPGNGDSMTLTFNQQPSSTSILSGWNGTSKVVTMRFIEAPTGPDLVAVFDGSTQVGLGTISLAGNYVTGDDNTYVAFPATMVLSSNVLTLTITGSGTPTGSNSVLRPPGSGGSADLVWTPASTIKDLSNNSINTAAVTETGTTDADF